MDFILNHLSEFLFGTVAILSVVLWKMERNEKLLAETKNEMQQKRIDTLVQEKDFVSQKYSLACKQIKEQREANRLLTDQLANSCTFNLIKNTKPITNADPEYYDLNHFGTNYYFTDTEVERARSRAADNPEDVKNPIPAASSPPSFKEGLGVVTEPTNNQSTNNQ